MGNLCDCALVGPEKTIRVINKENENVCKEKKMEAWDIYRGNDLTYKVSGTEFTYKEFHRAENPQSCIGTMMGNDVRIMDENICSNPIPSYSQYEMTNRWVVLHNQATASLVENKYDEALKLFQDALNLQLSIIGHKNHPNVALTMQNLGIVHRCCGNYEKASSCFWAAADIYGRVHLCHHCARYVSTKKFIFRSKILPTTIAENTRGRCAGSPLTPNQPPSTSRPAGVRHGGRALPQGEAGLGRP